MIGKTLVHYEITAEIGKGGMGEVYQAKDTKLGRDVAIKVLPEEFAMDHDRVARFQREAKLLASLNHPNIAAIYGLEESEGMHFLVMELIEGDTLRDRIKSGPIPVEEALKLALQMAEALEAAHENGVIHRDLKPANIKVTPDGKVKVLDFGLAKAYVGDQENLSPMDSPTISAAATQQGVILGTAAYMSPEQARGKPVDKRADIWAFGVVLFEMLTGQTAFQGEDVSETLASVIKGDSNLGLLPGNIHPRVREVITRCLQKEQKKRYGGIGDARYEIEQALSDPSGIFVQPSLITKPKKKLRVGISWLAATLVLGLVIAGVAVWYLKPHEPRRVIRFDYELPENQQFSYPFHQALAVSPDGTQFVYSTTEGLYLRDENKMNAKFIDGTDESPTYPFFSPDGQWIGYYSRADKKLKKITINGGAPIDLCDTSDITGASWSSDNMIVYGKYPGPIFRVSANGGETETLVEAEGVLADPQMLPDGKTVMFTQWLRGTRQGVVQSVETGKRIVSFPGHSAMYLPTGHIVYGIEDNLLAVPFDLDNLKLLGGGVNIVEGISINPDGLSMNYAVSESGTLAYVPESAGGESISTLVWVDREGKEEMLEAEPKAYRYCKISPDGTRVALSITKDGNEDIWIYDLVRGTMTRLTFDEANDNLAIWTPDSKRIIFCSERAERESIFWKAADGTGKVEQIASLPNGWIWPWSISNDGNSLFFGQSIDNETGLYNIGMLSMEGERTPKLLLKEKHNEKAPQISPDARWLAYQSNESGQYEVYIRPFPDIDSGGKWQVSTNGGKIPLWSPDGSELFYLSDDSCMAVEVGAEPTLKLGKTTVLFKGTYSSHTNPDGSQDTSWDIHPDGTRFLMMKPSPSIDAAPATAAPRPRINIVLNWFEELKQRVPVD
jgi:serine/threonine-protein kinase